MKKDLNSSESHNHSIDDTVSSPNRPNPPEHMVTVHVRNHTRPEPDNHFFAVIPDHGTESLLCQASETLASVGVMVADLARELEGPRRHLILAIQQMSALGELLVNRALDELEIPGESGEPSPNSQR
ncbi:MAG: DUF6124 family protein [Pseudomonas sp.]|uniref:DUF6124 family protein n=1 Tax=Pseudomonas sp. TaxID=306 RepID=UPI003D6F8CBA